MTVPLASQILWINQRLAKLRVNADAIVSAGRRTREDVERDMSCLSAIGQTLATIIPDRRENLSQWRTRMERLYLGIEPEVTEAANLEDLFKK